MKPTLPLLLAFVVAAQAKLQAPLQQTQEDPLNVPGKNPLNYCGSPETYLVDIEYVDLDPNPPVPGQQLTIKAGGTVKQRLASGSQVHVTVKLGAFVKIIDTLYDLCDKLGEVDLECPLEKGYYNITKAVDIPSEVPPTKFVVTAEAFTADGAGSETITCLTGGVNFGG